MFLYTLLPRHSIWLLQILQAQLSRNMPHQPVFLGGKGPLLTLTFQSVCLEHGIYNLSALRLAIQHSFSAHKVPSVVLGANVFIFVSYYWFILEV